MAKRHKIVEGLQEAISYATGDRTTGKAVRFKVPESVDVKSVREKLGLSQSEFALRFGFSLSAIRHWEQGWRHPEGPARVLLTVIARSPDLVTEVLEAEAAESRKAIAVG